MFNYQDYTSEEFRKATSAITKEVFALKAEIGELKKQRRTLETLMYMIYPKEAVRDGYMSANMVVEARLRRVREAEESMKETCSKKECMERVLAKGLCYEHYHEERRRMRSNGKTPPVLSTRQMLEIARK